MGRAEHLGTGIRNVYHYAPLYFGEEPLLLDEDMFQVQFRISSEKQMLINEPINEPIKSSLNVRQRGIEALISQNKYITKEELKDRCSVSISTIKRDIKLIGYVWVGTSRAGSWQKKLCNLNRP